MNLKAFMRTGGEFFEVIRDENKVAEVEGLPNREEATKKPYVGFFEGTDIQVGDWIRGKTSNDLLFIEDIKSQILHGKIFQIKAYYITKFQYEQKEKELQRKEQPSIIYNLNGANTRVNNNSTDNSTNIINTSTSDLFDEIRKVLKETVVDEMELRVLREIVNEMENNQNSKGFNQAYTKFITGAASHMTVLSPLIPALSQMIQS